MSYQNQNALQISEPTVNQSSVSTATTNDPGDMQPGWNGQPISANPTEEHWILSIGVPEIHFGFIKQSFPRGAVITHDVTNNRLVINGRVFYDTRDLDLLKSYSQKNPSRPWVIPWSKEAKEEVDSGTYQAQRAPNVKDPRDHQMPIVEDDSSVVNPIDISHTKVAANNAAAKNQHRRQVSEEPMEVIRGDETVEERIKRLASERWTPEIVHDDGQCVGSGKSMNAGQSFPSHDQINKNSESANKAAAARKKYAELLRCGAPSGEGAGVDSSLFDEVSPGFNTEPPSQDDSAAETSVDERFEILEGQVDLMAQNMGDMMLMLQQMMNGQTASEPERIPVTDPDAAAAVAAAASINND